MKKKNLVLLCDSYPLSAGEFFIDDEMRVIAPKFEKVFFLIKTQGTQDFSRFVPDNIEIVKYSDTITAIDKIKAIPNVLTLMFISELYQVLFSYKLSLTKIIFKIMFMDIVRAKFVVKQLKQLEKNLNLDAENVILYSYWHDYKALALSIFKKHNKSFTCVSRAHGWDVFRNRHNPPYLPFKKFIISTLDKTYSISKAGKIEFEQLLRNAFANKIEVSRLGKKNNRTPQIKKTKNDFFICSCSNIIPLKRIHLIIDIISKLNIENIKWVHFGDGYLKSELEEYALKHIKNVDFRFKGIVANSDILDFYANNYVDLFINVSEWEGIPVSIMEALSAGVPILATDVGGTSEAVPKEVGFLLKKDFIVEKALEIIEKYLALPIEDQLNYRKNAYQFWKENFDAEKNYLEFYDDIIRLT